MKQPPMKLRNWIPRNEVIEWELSRNPNAISYLEKNPHLISWSDLSANPNAIELLKKKLAIAEDPMDKKMDHINWVNLSMNPGAIPLLENNRDKIYLPYLLYNPNAGHLIESYMEKIIRYQPYIHTLLEHPTNIRILENYLITLDNLTPCDSHIPPNIPDASASSNASASFNMKKIHKNWKKVNIRNFYRRLSKNATRMDLLEKLLDKIDWTGLSQNPNAVPLLEKHLDKIDWDYLSMNPNAIPILEKNLDRVNWDYLSRNPNAVSILEKNLDKINWDCLSENPNAIHLIEQNPHKEGIDWRWLSTQPYTMDLLKKNIGKIDWHYLSENPAIFTYDYDAMCKANLDFKEELIQRAWHPSRVAGWLEAGMDLDDL